MNNKVALESLVMDLKRVALGYHRGSFIMAKRFTQEALKRKQEINEKEIKPYIKTILNNLDTILHNVHTEKIAEDSLMISTILQNYTQKYLR